MLEIVDSQSCSITACEGRVSERDWLERSIRVLKEEQGSPVVRIVLLETTARATWGVWVGDVFRIKAILKENQELHHQVNICSETYPSGNLMQVTMMVGANRASTTNAKSVKRSE